MTDLEKIEDFYYRHHMKVMGRANHTLDVYYAGKLEGIRLVRKFLEGDWETIQELRENGVFDK